MKHIVTVLTITTVGFLMGCGSIHQNSNIKESGIMEPQDVQIIGNKFKVDFGEYVFELHFETETQMTYRPLGSDALGKAETVEITRTELRPNVFMVYWKEKSDTTVTHVQDFEKETVFTNITTPDNSFLNMKGTLTLIKN